MKKLISIIFLFLLFQLSFVFAQDSLQVQEGEITISASVDILEVPLNSSVAFTIKIEWIGGQGRYEIGDFENPVLTNFVISENSSSNIVEDRNGTQYTVKLYNYVLEPLEMGMAYIDGVIVKYTDTGNDESSRILTKRIGVEVLRPVEERDWSLAFYSLIAAHIVGGFVFSLIKFKRHRDKKREEELKAQEPVIIVEDKYLSELKKIESEPDINFNDKLNKVSVIFRNYLSEKYEISFEGKSNRGFISALNEKGIEEEIREKMQLIFEKSEVLRFSGQEVTRDAYLDIYGSVETIIDKNRMQNSKAQNTEE